MTWTVLEGRRSPQQAAFAGFSMKARDRAARAARVAELNGRPNKVLRAAIERQIERALLDRNGAAALRERLLRIPQASASRSPQAPPLPAESDAGAGDDEALAAEVLAAMPCGVLICRYAVPGRFVLERANPAARTATGIPVDERVGEGLADVWPTAATPAFATIAQEVLRTGEPAPLDDGWDKGGRSAKAFRAYAFRMSPRRLAILFEDVTKRHTDEKQRRRIESHDRNIQRHESLGALAGGIAHEFNNLLVGILGNADLALLEMTQQSPARDRIEDLKEAALRASEITAQMLTYSGKGHLVLERVNLNDLVREACRLPVLSESGKIELVCDLDDNLPDSRLDIAQIRHVIVHLLTNAAEAIGDAPGKITVRTGVSTLPSTDSAEICLDDDLAAVDKVFVEVSDTGCGMEAEKAAHVFDPFFTTKFMGRGMGMAASLGIARAHGGSIKVASRPGNGATFTLMLPPPEPPSPDDAPSDRS